MTDHASRDDLDRLVAGTHVDPHTVLGPRPTAAGLLIRALRPSATRVRVLFDDGTTSTARTAQLTRIHDGGVFEGVLPGVLEVRPYRLEATYANGATWTTRDPYAFLPTLGAVDLHLSGEGRHERLWERLGAHPGHATLGAGASVAGVSFAVWAPEAARVSVVGDFNRWDGRTHAMRRLGESGVWELFIPDLAVGALYQYEVRTHEGLIAKKADPLAFRTLPPPSTASMVDQDRHVWRDAEWLAARRGFDARRRPLSIYEVHLGSWRRVVEDGKRSLTYAEHARALVDYVADLGFTHVQLLPVMEHPFGGSWGYQVTSYFAPTARWGTPDELRELVDAFHQRGIGVLLDWVPAHFPRDAWALARFDGTALYEHLDPRKGEHPDWGTLVFNLGRNEVRNFLIASALYWLDSFHIDGLRVDAVASMLYLDYSRKEGQWEPNEHGGRENLEAVAFFRELADTVHRTKPGALLIAEESTAWPKVTHPTHEGGLGFDLKWDMGWMHDTLDYFQHDPLGRNEQHHRLTFGIIYMDSEAFVLPLSHDEVVHLKGSLLAKMPGDLGQKHAGLRSLYATMWSRPGRKLVFMGGELAQRTEWNHDRSLDWHLLDEPLSAGVHKLVRRLNALYKSEPALYEADGTHAGFRWIDPDDRDANVIVYRRIAPSTGEELVCISNFSGAPHRGYRIALPLAGTYRVLLDTEAAEFGGSRTFPHEPIASEDQPKYGLPCSAPIDLAPRSALWLKRA
jgi:1,4-alpha-glucan branching enzyme